MEGGRLTRPVLPEEGHGGERHGETINGRKGPAGVGLDRKSSRCATGKAARISSKRG